MPVNLAQSFPTRAECGDKVVPEGGAAQRQALDFIGPDLLLVDLAVQATENLFRPVELELRSVVFVRVLIVIRGGIWLQVDLGPTLDLGYGARRQAALRSMLADIKSEGIDRWAECMRE